MVTGVLVLAFLALTGPPPQQPAWPQTLEQAQRIVRLKITEGRGNSLGPITLDGLESARLLELGNDLSVLSVSGRWESGLLAFGPDHRLLAGTRTDRVMWMMLCDLDGDGVSELLTEEETERGTGILAQAFVLYVIDDAGISKAWSAESLYRSAQMTAGGQEVVRERHAYLRLEGRRLYYLTRSGTASSEKAFELRGRRLQDVTVSSDRK